MNRNVCKICLSEEEDPEEDPLISPCKCSGTMGTIHLSCLKNWLSSKIHTKTGEHIMSYNWKNLQCELCKTKYRPRYVHNKRTYNVIDYQRAEDCDHFIEFESFTNTPHKTIHIISIPELDPDEVHSFSVGRESGVDYRITDISVSRFHAKISVVGGDFFIEDMGSKFGTSVLLQTPIKIEKCPGFMIKL